MSRGIGQWGLPLAPGGLAVGRGCGNLRIGYDMVKDGDLSGAGDAEMCADRSGMGTGGTTVSAVAAADELILMDVNGDPGNTNDCDPDHTALGENDQDRRYYYHQDRNWNVIALSEYDDGVGVNGRIAERYAYTPYGEFVVLNGDAGSGELGQVLVASGVGNPFFHQGLPFDQEKGSYQNRHREYAARVQRFAQRDPLHYSDGLDPYPYVRANPANHVDPTGKKAVVGPVTDCNLTLIRCYSRAYSQFNACVPDALQTCLDLFPGDDWENARIQCGVLLLEVCDTSFRNAVDWCLQQYRACLEASEGGGSIGTT